MTEMLSMADLEQFDPRSPARSGERRFCCPLCGSSKPVDAAHRSLAVNTQTGAYMCHRCRHSGVLREFRDTRSPALSRRVLLRQRALQRFAAPEPEQTDPLQEDPGADWRRRLRIQHLGGTPGETYLQGRGLDPALASVSGARWCADFLGRPAVVFPFRDAQRALAAVQGRYVDGRSDPKARTVGRISCGIFATPGAREAVTVAIAEAPIDALSLAQSGMPALALGGVAVREWLCRELAFKTVCLAFDADEAGERAAAEWEAALRFDTRVIRLRPTCGCKDWNERLQRGALRFACVQCGAQTGGYDWCDRHDPFG